MSKKYKNPHALALADYAETAHAGDDDDITAFFYRIVHAMESLEAALKAERTENETLRADRCETCGATLYSGPPDCHICGAPQCCQQCCEIDTLRARVKKLEVALEFDNAEDSAYWEPPHPIFQLADENDKLKAKIKRVETALSFISEWGFIGGGHHKQWVLDQLVRILATNYDEWVKEFENGEDGPKTYLWDEGIAP